MHVFMKTETHSPGIATVCNGVDDVLVLLFFSGLPLFSATAAWPAFFVDQPLGFLEEPICMAASLKSKR